MHVARTYTFRHGTPPPRRVALVAALCAFAWTNPAPAQPQQSDTWVTAVHYETFHVVLPEDSPEELQYAAEIFTRYWALCTNHEITASPINEGVTNVWLGPEGITSDLLREHELEDLGPEGYLLRSYAPSRRYRGLGAREQLVISGKTPRGTLNGVFAFFRDHMGVRWLVPGQVHVPLAHYRIRPIDETYRPHFALRESAYFDLFAQDPAISKADLLEYRRAHGFPDAMLRLSVETEAPSEAKGESPDESGEPTLVNTVRIDEVAYKSIATYACDHAAPFADSSHQATKWFVSTLEELKKSGERVIVRECAENMLNPAFPFPVLEAAQQNLQWYDQLRVGGVVIDANPNPDWKAALRPLQSYVAHSLLWDPDRMTDELVDEFLALYYGDAAGDVAAALARFGDALADSDSALCPVDIPIWASKSVVLGPVDSNESAESETDSSGLLKLGPAGPAFAPVEGLKRSDFRLPIQGLPPGV